MQGYFNELADELMGGARGREVLLACFSGEDSDFARFSRGLVRQAGSVAQRSLSLELIEGARRLRAVCSLSGQKDADGPRGRQMLADLRAKLAHVPEDPYLLYATEVRNTQSVKANRLPDRRQVVEAVLRAGAGRDLVGIAAMGGIHAGFANSLGQRNWFSTYTFHVSWSLYHAADKAVKTAYAGFEWDDAAFERKAAGAAGQLEVLARTPKTIPPGEYRVYLAPEALRELMAMLCWGGFGVKSHRTKTTGLLKMIEQGVSLNPAITLRENTCEGMAAGFDSAGFIKPDRVMLIDAGRYRECLISPRSAKEYGLSPNGASEGESPESLDLAAGDLPAKQVLQRLGTGVYVNHLWYLNYSDRPACRITGMTRFATFWAEDGRIVAPLNVMRFDETIYRVLGENLLGLTAERELLPSSSTYGERSTESMCLPGALADGFRFTL